ncbi:MAG: M43 family zinc metalloprotease [Rikenellaceae bacterium]
MRTLKFLTLFAFVATLAVGCSKEDLNKQANQDSNMATKSMPKPCKIGLDENGNEMKPAELSAELYAAAMATKADQVYTIPVVFHIFGASQGSGTLNAARIEKVLTWINNDYNGIKNSGDKENFSTIAPARDEFVGYLPVKFVLAKNYSDGTPIKKDDKIYGGKPSATSTYKGTASGDCSVIIYSASHPLAKAGPGVYDSQTTNEMKKVAWDNKMYMNVYITNDLYADGYTNNSGVAWYPDATMTNNNIARVVYNGAYLPGGTYYDKDFTSVITHEFGHFLNLAHTFNENGSDKCNSSLADGGSYGDQVKDTPQMENSSGSASNGWQQNTAYYGHGKKNCKGEVIDFGNFMNYGVYCNFTQGQVARMKAALQAYGRKSLWQQSNLDKVLGVGATDPTDPTVKDPATMGDKLDALDKAVSGK